MTTKNFENKITETIKLLSDPSSYAIICSENRTGGYLPSRSRLSKIIDIVRELIFPGYFENTTLQPKSIQYYIGLYIDELYKLLSEEILAGMCFNCHNNADSDDELSKRSEKAKEISAEFIEYLPEIRRKLIKDVETTFLYDPAAHSCGEIIFCYPAIKAIINYRMAHKLFQLNVPLIPRFISEMAHSETGIDIHPHAEIGENFTIDHGTGVVIGSTSIIGNNVKIYQGVTLGAKSFPLDENGNPIKGIPRHPIVEDDVVIYAGATILGRVTIGKGSVIGGNVWVTKDVPPYSKLVQSHSKEAPSSTTKE